jgi:hypothetical protein
MPQRYSKPKGKMQFMPDSQKYLYNIDTFWFNVDAKNYQDIMDNGFREDLRSAREHLMDTDESKTIEIELSQYENPISFEIKSGQPPLYQYSIRNEDIAIYFSKNQRDNGQLPMKVQINQFILWEKGLQDAYQETLQILTALGFHYTYTKLNRVDFAVHSDQWQWNLEDLKKFDYPRNIKNDNFPNFFRLSPESGVFETVYFGDRTRCQLRIYNKSKESKDKQKDYFLKMYERLGMDKDNVWNVEIECRRDFIKEFVDITGVRLFDDLDKVFSENGLSQLWTFLMNKYDHNSAFWTQLKKGKEGIFEDCVGHLDREKDIDSSLDREVAQIRGRLMKFVINEENDGVGQAINNFFDRMQVYEVKKDRNFNEEVQKKKMKYNSYEINKKVKKTPVS